MDAKSKFREAVRSCNEAADAVVKSDDRGKREILEQIRALYHRLARLLVKYMQSRRLPNEPETPDGSGAENRELTETTDEIS
jgi:hypothetical protein